MVCSGRPRDSDSRKQKIVRAAVVVCANSRVMKFQHRLCRTAVPHVAVSVMALALVACSSVVTDPDALPATSQPGAVDAEGSDVVREADDSEPEVTDGEENADVGDVSIADAEEVADAETEVVPDSSDPEEVSGNGDESAGGGSDEVDPEVDESVGDDENQPEETPSPEGLLAELVGDSYVVSDVVETQCGVMAAAISGNDTLIVDGDFAEAVVVHDLRWDGGQWTSQQEELVPAWERSDESFNPFEARSGISLHYGDELSSSVRLTMTYVWESGWFSYVEHLNANCEWVPSDVAFPCGVVNHVTRASIEPGAFVNAYQPNWSPEGDLDQPNCYSQENHALVWHSDIGMFQALPVSGGCPDGYADELLPNIRMCERGDDINYLQRNGLDFEPDEVDGFFGPATQRALIALQQSVGADNEFGIEVTGIFDDALANALYSGWNDY